MAGLVGFGAGVGQIRISGVEGAGEAGRIGSEHGTAHHEFGVDFEELALG